uniref:Uncharacterized protein n=1 Tax=Electrophorus electricus TaxID=8005 RepID=A0AAY5EUI4_ELEEL
MGPAYPTGIQPTFASRFRFIIGLNSNYIGETVLHITAAHRLFWGGGGLSGPERQQLRDAFFRVAPTSVYLCNAHAGCSGRARCSCIYPWGSKIGARGSLPRRAPGNLT